MRRAPHVLLLVLFAPIATAFRSKTKRRSSDPARHMKDLYPFYHTSAEIQSELSRLSTKCNGAMSVRNVSRDGVDIPVVNVRDPKSKPINKVFMLFGEHSRELISPESGLHFLKTLCGDAPNSAHAFAQLADSEFQMVMNGNPGSRKDVEKGWFCLRANPRGVDLNRNWDEHFDYGNSLTQTDGGKHPFSEPETQIFKELVSEYKPTTFLSVHSGTRGMYMPYAWSREQGLGVRNQASMMEVMKTLDEKHCKCPYGAAGKEVGYDSPGTCIDWVYDNMDTPYTFAFEIFSSPSQDQKLSKRWQEKVNSGALLQLHSDDGHLAMDGIKDIFEDHASDFIQLQSTQYAAANASTQSSAGWFSLAQCFDMFNPNTEEKYNQLVDNWSNAYLEMSQQIASQLKQKAQDKGRQGRPRRPR